MSLVWSLLRHNGCYRKWCLVQRPSLTRWSSSPSSSLLFLPHVETSPDKQIWMTPSKIQYLSALACNKERNKLQFLQIKKWPGLPCEHKNITNFFCFCSIITYRTICTNTIKSLPLLQNLMGFLLKLTEIKYLIQRWRY